MNMLIYANRESMVFSNIDLYVLNWYELFALTRKNPHFIHVLGFRRWLNFHTSHDITLDKCCCVHESNFRFNFDKRFKIARSIDIGCLFIAVACIVKFLTF